MPLVALLVALLVGLAKTPKTETAANIGFQTFLLDSAVVPLVTS